MVWWQQNRALQIQSFLYTIEISIELEEPFLTSARAITDKFLDEVRVRASKTDETITTDSDFWHFSVPYINGISFPMVWWPLPPSPEAED